MAESTTDLDRALTSLFAEEHAGVAGHVEPEELLAYHEGELAPEDARRVRDHLEGCRDCVAALLDLETLAAPDPPRADGATDFELAAAWRTFRKSVDGAGRRPTLRWFQAAAAVLLASTLGLSAWVIELRQARQQSSEPRLNVPVLYVESTRGPDGFDGRIEIPAGEESFMLFLMPTDLREFASYEVEISGTGGGLAWSGGGLELSDYGALRIGLSRRFLPTGDYRIRLYGVSGEGREPLDDFLVEIRWLS